MELRDNPDEVTAADIGNVTILGRGCRRGICSKDQRRKAEEARCHHEPQERPPVLAGRSGEASEPIHPDVALPSPHHLPCYGFMAAGGAGSVASGVFHWFFACLALFLTLLFFQFGFRPLFYQQLEPSLQAVAKFIFVFIQRLEGFECRLRL